MTRRRAGTTCDFSGKRRYRDKTEATKALRTILSQPRPGKLPCRVYPCPKCQGYHLTSQEGRT